MSRRAYFEAAMIARGGFAQDDSIAFGASAPRGDAKETDDVLVNPVKECAGNPDDDDHGESVYEAQSCNRVHSGSCVPKRSGEHLDLL
jgi:hypothetical protein